MRKEQKTIRKKTPMTRLKQLRNILLIILLTSCREDTYFHAYQPVNELGWNRNDTLNFTLSEPIPAGTPLSFEIGIRHKDSYPYRDLWLTVNGDTCHLFFADTIGKWSGNGIGEIRHLSCPISFQIKEDSLRKLDIMHIMQDNPLQGIDNVGIYIRKKN